jgi:hypothetical protein
MSKNPDQELPSGRVEEPGAIRDLSRRHVLRTPLALAARADAAPALLSRATGARARSFEWICLVERFYAQGSFWDRVNDIRAVLVALPLSAPPPSRPQTGTTGFQRGHDWYPKDCWAIVSDNRQ